MNQPRTSGRIRATIAASVIAAAGLLSAACSANTTAPPSTGAPAPSAGANHHDRALRGTISAENADTWTVTNAKGAAYTVDITPTTAFGTKKAPATQQSFQVGNHVVVVGTRSGTTIQATRVATPAGPTPAGPGPSPTPAG
ncbi:MAG TPA: DUF5666 domain-containing protein [Pseudonocardia sp.]|jgi:hypothetical protein|nr:DUF5666 domain-containing protein [Pseudonocardia sp.]